MQTIDGNTIKNVYYSMDEWANAALSRSAKAGLEDYDAASSWRGATMTEAVKLAKEGWAEELQEAMDIAESAVDMVEKNHEVKAFQPVWDVSGADVDVARYLSGEPENMIDFPMQEISQHGKVITLCASISYSSSIRPGTIKRRGQVLCALALLLARIGYASELWIDMHAADKLGGDIKVMVKGTNDTLDPAKVMFAYAHPAALRCLMFGIQDGYPERFLDGVNVKGGRGVPAAPVKDLPEGTIYLPGIKSGRDIPDAHEELRGLLRTIGLLAE